MIGIGVLVVLGLALLTTAGQGQRVPVKPEGPCTITIDCTANAPTKATVGEVLAFSSSVSGVPGSLYATDSIVGNLRYVPAGTFTQGTPSTEVGRSWWEGPQFQHTLTKNLAVMETEVTRQMWATLKAAQPTLPADPTDTSKGSGMTNPVQRVLWYKTVLFANLLSAQQGLGTVYFADSGFVTPITSTNSGTNDVFAKWDASGYRLPTEGEWEYFIRAGTAGPFSINEPAYNELTHYPCPAAGALAALESVAWFCTNAGSTAHAVGSKAANPWGLKDVYGNVEEYCWDRDEIYPDSSQTDYRGPSTGDRRAYRGGSWTDSPVSVRSGWRNSILWNEPLINNLYILGFRLLRSVN